MLSSGTLCLPFPRRIPFNPCDYLFLAHHRLLERQGLAGYTALMVVETMGRPDPGWIRASLDNLLRRHPVLLAGVGISRFLARPYWRLPTAGEIPKLAERCFRHHDLRGRGDSRSAAAEGMESLYRCELPDGGRWSLQRGPMLRLEQYDVAEDRSMIFLRWPHFLMDAEGAQWLLSELQGAAARHGRDACATRGQDACSTAPREMGFNSRPEGLRECHLAPAGVLRDYRGLRRFRLLREGLRLQRQVGRAHTLPLVTAEAEGERETRVLHRFWTGSQLDRLQAIAKEITPSGPRLYARFLAACVLRALERIYREAGASSPSFVIPLPMSVAPAGAAEAGAPPRPIAGNYLVSPNLVVDPNIIADRRALGAEIARQLADYAARQGDLAQWSSMWMASALRIWMYDLLLRMPLGFGSLSSGFSYYGEIVRPIRSIGGAAVCNVWGAGPMATPPGWNPVFSRFGDTLNLSLTYNRPGVPDELARRFVELIEEEAAAEP